MKETRLKLFNIIMVMVGAILGSGIFLLLSGERGWLKYIGWVVFFAAILSPFFYARGSDWNCFSFSRSKKRG